MKKSRNNQENLRPQRAGEAGHNPNGRPKKYVTQVTEATGYKLSQIQDCIKSMLTMNLVELKKVGESSAAPALEVLIARGINGDLKRGELKNLETLLGRSFGKPKEQVDIEANINLGLTPELDAAVKILNERNRNKE
jgi:hypothetical protein